MKISEFTKSELALIYSSVSIHIQMLDDDLKDSSIPKKIRPQIFRSKSICENIIKKLNSGDTTYSMNLPD